MEPGPDSENRTRLFKVFLPAIPSIASVEKLKNMQWKGLLVIALISLVAIAVATRVSLIRNLVFGASTPAAS